MSESSIILSLFGVKLKPQSVGMLVSKSRVSVPTTSLEVVSSRAISLFSLREGVDWVPSFHILDHCCDDTWGLAVNTNIMYPCP